MKYTDLFTNEHEALAALTALAEPADITVGRLVHWYGAAGALRYLFTDEVARHVDPKPLALVRKTIGPRLIDARPGIQIIEESSRLGIRLISPGDEEWPVRLADLGARQPFALWVKGKKLEPAPPYTVAIVGARACTAYGEHVTGELTAELSERGYTIVSGAAYGIDGTAHRAALAVDGSTIAVLVGGLDRPYPVGHHDLIDRIAASGSIVSEVPIGGAPTKWRLIARNRVIAGMSDGMVVVEAGWRSGSLAAAHNAFQIKRPVMAVPGPITSAASAGCHRLIRESGARLVTSADDVAEVIER